MNYIYSATLILALVSGFFACIILDLKDAESYKVAIEGPQGYKIQLEALGRVVQAANSKTN